MRVSRAVEKLKKYLQKNGVTVPVAILGTTLLENAVQAAPASCAQAVGKATLLSGSTTAKAHLISQEVLKSMVVIKWKAASLIAALGIVGAACVSNGVAREPAPQPIATPNPAWPSGVPIMQKSKAAYAALSAYNGMTTVRTQSVMDGRPSEYNGTAKIQFRRPNLLHIEGQLAGGGDGTYRIAYDGEATMVDYESYGKKEPTSRYPTPERAVDSMTGVAASAPTFIPSALMGFKRTPFKDFEDARLEGQEAIDGAPCNRVSITLPHDKETFWVDAKTSLLRRYKRERDQIDAGAFYRKRGEPVPEDTPKSYSSTAVHDFAIESAS